MPVIAVAPAAALVDYEASLRRAGGEPRILDQTSDAAAGVIADVDGLLLAGGGDVLPSLYGAARDSTFNASEAGRDEYEIELIHRALDADLPVFAICRGLQVLNVARGGTLVLDIPRDVGSAVRHDVRDSYVADAHDVQIVPGSRLADVLDSEARDGRCVVNSRHHQAALRLGEGLVVSAVAADGLIEAIEDPSHRFHVGVQWHPENYWRTGRFAALFEAFVRACQRT